MYMEMDLILHIYQVYIYNKCVRGGGANCLGGCEVCLNSDGFGYAADLKINTSIKPYFVLTENMPGKALTYGPAVLNLLDNEYTRIRKTVAQTAMDTFEAALPDADLQEVRDALILGADMDCLRQVANTGRTAVTQAVVLTVT